LPQYVSGSSASRNVSSKAVYLSSLKENEEEDMGLDPKISTTLKETIRELIIT